MPRKKKEEEIETHGLEHIEDTFVDGLEEAKETETTTPDEGAIPEQDSKIPVARQLTIALGMLLLIFGTALADDIKTFFVTTPTEAEVQPIQERVAATEEIPRLQTYTEPPNEHAIIGASAFVWDVKNQRALYNKNADEQLPLASVTKLMTALVAYELLAPEDRVEISAEALRQGGDSGLLFGETFTAQDLSNLTLIVSSNDGAHALAAAAGATLSDDNPADTFVKAMNIRAEELGLTQTYFNNATGLDIGTTKNGGYGSARDIAFLMEYILTNHLDLLEYTSTDETYIANGNGETHFAQNTNLVVEDIDGLIASKTGYTDLAGGNLVVAFNAGLNRPVIAVVLGSTRNGRFSDILTLTEFAKTAVAGSTP